MAGIWSIDIETIGAATQSVRNLRHEIYHEMCEEIGQDRELPKGQRRYIDQRLTDPAKIMAAIDKKLAEGANLEHPKDSLNPLTAQPICVVCVSMAPIIYHKTEKPPDSNERVFTDIDKFYQWAKEEPNQFVGFNIKDFDLPVLRMWLARTTDGQIPDIPALRRQPIELREELGSRYDHSTYSTPRDLRHYIATILNIEAQLDGVVKEYLESKFTGADVGAAYMDWETGGKEKIVHHCTLDALMVALIARKMRIC